MKRWIRLGAIVAVIAAMVVAIVVLRSTEGRDADAVAETAERTVDEQTDRVPLLENPRDEIESISIETDESELTVVRTEGEEDENIFLPVYEHDVEFETRALNRIVSGAASLTSRRVIGEVDDLSEYGLADPSATVTVVQTDGEQQRIIVGDQTPARNAYYVMRPGDDTVYTVYNTWVRPFFTSLDELRVRTIPQITFEELAGITIETIPGRTIRIRQVPRIDEDPELGFAGFVVTEPFQRRFQANTQWIEDLKTQLAELEIGEYVDDAPTDLSRYGLDDPRARIVISDEEQTLELLVGSETDEGRFAKFAETPSVFVLGGSEPIAATDPYDVISPFALIVNIELIDRFLVEAPDATYTGRIERTPVEGEEEPEESYFLNGEQIEEDLFKDLYQWAIGLQLDAEIPPAETADTTQTPLATITYFLNNDMEPLEVSFVPLNANFAAVVREGESEFIISRAKIRRMLGAFEEAADAL